MATLATVVTAIQTQIRAVDGVKYAPDLPPDSADDFPFAVTYPGTFGGELNTPEDYKTLWGLRVELHITRSDLIENMSLLIPYAELIPTAFLTALIAQRVAFGKFTGGFGGMVWGGKDTIGYWWQIGDVKIVTPLS